MIWLAIPCISLLLLRNYCGIHWKDLGLVNIRNLSVSPGTFVRVAVVFVSLWMASMTEGAFRLIFIPPSNAFSYENFMPRGNMKNVVLIYLALTAAVVEEIYFRGFLAWFLKADTNSVIYRVGFVLLSSALFALGHLEYGIAKSLSSLIFGLVASTLYLRLRNVWYLIFGHLLINLIATW